MCFNLIEFLYLKQRGNLVYYDTLTGAKSRQYYDMKAKVKYHRKEVQVAFVDVDNLKRINDEYGHTTGSETLKHVAGLMLAIPGVVDVCRIGGDEFVIIGNFDIDKLCEIEGISYGTYFKEKFEDMSSAVRKSDDNMYKCKLRHHDREVKVVDKRKAKSRSDCANEAAAYQHECDPRILGGGQAESF